MNEVYSKKNRLYFASSPYLQQHADNPVDWYLWGEEAIEAARRENKPILLSIGYFACHWCHVMARESFEDAKTAEIMNQYFINVKVDREERPDLDRIYQLAHQLLTGHGGWPLTIFLTPHDLIPFYTGTYFPPVPRYGMPSFNEVLLKIANYFKKHADEISKQNIYLKDALLGIESPSLLINHDLNDKQFSEASKELANFFDKHNGGFGNAPKFPHPSNLQYLVYEGDEAKIAHFSLLKMAKGGIYDQLGGGFFRYSVDAEWKIPHFEKMLYDNAQLLFCYSQAGLAHEDPHFTRVVSETIEWLLEEMQSPEGAFYSALDADSEHVEGKYYYWDEEEIQQLLTDEECQVVSIYYGLQDPPNFEKHWHLRIVNENVPYPVLKNAKQKLLMARKKRISPGRDEKILTSWNALLIKGICLASQYLRREDLMVVAKKIVNFIKDNLWKDNKLYACYRNKQVYQVAYLDDYIFLIDALVEMLQRSWDTQYLHFASDLAEELIKNYYDKVGGFFFTPHEYEPLICRSKPLIDGVLPSGNGVAAFSFARLGYLLGKTDYLEIAEKTLQIAWSSLQSAPSSHCTLLKSLSEYFDPPEVVIIRANEKKLKVAHESYSKKYDPRKMIFVIPNSEINLPFGLKERVGDEEKIVIYRCKGTQCNEKSLF